jgi:hypothetical protein
MRIVDYSATSVHKFGANADIDTATVPEDIWAGGGAYPFASVAAASTIVSDSTDDAAAGTGARTVRVYGLDSNWEPVEETATLNGTSSVALSNSYLRVYRAKVLTAGTAETNVGTISVDIDSVTSAVIPADKGQTLQAVFTSAANEMWELISLYVSVTGKTTGVAEMALQMRTDGGAWQTKFLAQANDTSPISYEAPVPIIIQPKTDVRVRALDVAANDTSIAALFGMVMISA